MNSGGNGKLAGRTAKKNRPGNRADDNKTQNPN